MRSKSNDIGIIQKWIIQITKLLRNMILTTIVILLLSYILFIFQVPNYVFNTIIALTLVLLLFILKS